MIKKLYIISILIFLVASALPFINTGKETIKPMAKEVKDDKKQKFNKSSLQERYTQENPIHFTYSNTRNINSPKINAQNALVVDLNKNEIIYSKNEKERKPVASLAKIMTGIIAVEHSRLNKNITISESAASIGENTMGLEKGEEYTLEELLYGLILQSGNDAGRAIAESIGGDLETFVYFMNKKAELLGANNTLFADASGLNSNNSNFYSTALDIAKIAAYSQNNHPELKKIYNTQEKNIEANESRTTKYLTNQTNLLTTYPGVKGMKTGYTDDAGLCLVSYAENENQEILVVILDSTDRRGDAILLLDYAFNQLGVTVEHDLL